jgi:hypothetical protein
VLYKYQVICQEWGLNTQKRPLWPFVYYSEELTETAAGLKHNVFDVRGAKKWCVQPSPLEQLGLSGTAIGPLRTSVESIKHEENTKPREKNIDVAAPRSLREATATRLLRWRTR